MSNNLDEVARILIGPNAKGKDLGSVESIIAAMGTEGEQFLANLEADTAFASKKVPVAAEAVETLEDKQLARIKALTGSLLNSSVMISGSFVK